MKTVESTSEICGVGPEDNEARLEYDAASSSTKRRSFSSVLRSEDTVLPVNKRRTVSGGVRSLRRNFSVLDWAIRRHLDYTTQFHLQSQSGDAGFDEVFEQWFQQVTQPEAFDLGGRFSFSEFLRILESCALSDGDCGALKVRSGHIQGIESDLIKDPTDARQLRLPGRWVNGTRVNSQNRAIEYAVHRRGDTGNGYEFERLVKSKNLFLHGYFHRFDQVRGISPIVTGLNDFQDIYEGKELAFAKMKVNQLFALAFYRDADEAAGELNTDAAIDDMQEEQNRAGYSVDFGKGPAVLDMDPGDRAEFLESDSPGGNTQEFLQLVIQIALKSIDIPFSFFNESFTNFFGSRAAWLHYERSCVVKRARLIKFANDWLLWRFRIALIRGEIKAPAKVIEKAYQYGQLWFEFVPVGMPWWDPAKEIKADVLAIEAGLTSPQRVCRQHGLDFYEIQKQRAAAKEYAEGLGVPLLGVPQNVSKPQDSPKEKG